MRTAVCWREVVAPPISSGVVMPRRCISPATFTISSSDGVIRPDSPTMSALFRRGGVQDRGRGHHHAEVDDLVVVAAEHHADDVLADVVHVALDGGEHHLAVAAGPRGGRRGGLLGVHERLEVGDGALHHAGGLHHLRQEHLPRPEQVAHDLHAVHQRALDDVERAFRLLAGLLGVGLDVVGDAVHEGVRRGAASTGASRQDRSASARLAPPWDFTFSANATSRSVASGRRSNRTSSTSSFRSAGMSS